MTKCDTIISIYMWPATLEIGKSFTVLDHFGLRFYDIFIILG